MATSQQTVFGPGTLFAKVSGGAYKKLGAIQEFSFDEAKDTKELYGSYQFPIDVATATIKLSGKFKQAQINASAYNDIFFGQTATTGQSLTAIGEAGTVPASSTYTITVANSAHFAQDLGVTYTDGTALTLVTTLTAAGQYTVSAGVYTFYSGDASKSVLISYQYTSATGIKINNTQQLIGSTVVCSLYYVTQHNGKELNLEFPQAVIAKLAMGFKLADFTIPEFDVMMFADSTGLAYTWNSAV